MFVLNMCFCTPYFLSFQSCLRRRPVHVGPSLLSLRWRQVSHFNFPASSSRCLRRVELPRVRRAPGFLSLDSASLWQVAIWSVQLLLLRLRAVLSHSVAVFPDSVMTQSCVGAFEFWIRVMQCKICRFEHPAQEVLLKHDQLCHYQGRYCQLPCLYTDCICSFKTTG